MNNTMIEKISDLKREFYKFGEMVDNLYHENDTFQNAFDKNYPFEECYEEMELKMIEWLNGMIRELKEHDIFKEIQYELAKKEWNYCNHFGKLEFTLGNNEVTIYKQSGIVEDTNGLYSNMEEVLKELKW